MAFEEPTILYTGDRSYNDKYERLQLEQGEYQGRATFALRITWQAEDGTWRWSQARPSQTGKCWRSLNLKARELRELGEALIAAADSTPGEAIPRGGQQRSTTSDRRGAEPPRPTGQPGRQPTRREQQELDRFEGQRPAAKCSDFDDDDLPF